MKVSARELNEEINDLVTRIRERDEMLHSIDEQLQKMKIEMATLHEMGKLGLEAMNKLRDDNLVLGHELKKQKDKAAQRERHLFAALSSCVDLLGG